MTRAAPSNEGKRIALLSRTTKSLRARLDEAAEQSGRSLSQEVELRLERSFEHDAIAARLDRIERMLGQMAQLQQVPALSLGPCPIGNPHCGHAGQLVSIYGPGKEWAFR